LNLKKEFVRLKKGISLAYYDIGTGMPIVFCHGLGGNADNWTHPKSAQVQFFSKISRVLSFDLKGYGDSDKSEQFSYAISEFARELHEAIDQIAGDERIILVGHSMGGMVAQEYALQFPDNLRGLVLVATYSHLKVDSSYYKFQEWILKQTEERSLEELESFVSEQLVKQGVSLMFYRKYLRRNPDMIEWAVGEQKKVPIHVLAACMHSIFQFNVHEHLGQITVPTLIFVGNRDQTIPPSYSKDMHEKIPVSELKIFENCGHMIQFEKREEFNFELEKFIASLS